MDSVASATTNFDLSEDHRELQERTRAFTEEVLFPFEMECEENEGLAAESISAITWAVVEWEFNAVNHTRDDGARATMPSSRCC